MRLEKNASPKIAQLKGSTKRFYTKMLSKMNQKISDASYKLQRTKQPAVNQAKIEKPKIAGVSSEVQNKIRQIVEGNYL